MNAPTSRNVSGLHLKPGLKKFYGCFSQERVENLDLKVCSFRGFADEASNAQSRFEVASAYREHIDQVGQDRALEGFLQATLWLGYWLGVKLPCNIIRNPLYVGHPIEVLPPGTESPGLCGKCLGNTCCASALLWLPVQHAMFIAA